MTQPKKYKVIYCDPAWEFKNRKTGGSMTSSAEDQYRVTSITEMAALPVAELAAEDCLLVMWYVGSMPDEALMLARAWGFRVTNINGFVWNKLTRVNGLPFFGMGFSTRAGSESALIAVKGKIKNLIVNKSVRAVITARVGKHSQKPHQFRKAIEKLCGDVPRIELFARERQDGWDALGDGVDGLSLADSIRQVADKGFESAFGVEHEKAKASSENEAGHI